jgi:hypothetical protein
MSGPVHPARLSRSATLRVCVELMQEYFARRGREASYSRSSGGNPRVVFPLAGMVLDGLPVRAGRRTCPVRCELHLDAMRTREHRMVMMQPSACVIGRLDDGRFVAVQPSAYRDEIGGAAP